MQKLSEAKSMDMLPAHQIQELEDSEEWRKSGRSLQSLLIKPVQRLPRFTPPLLFTSKKMLRAC